MILHCQGDLVICTEHHAGDVSQIEFAILVYSMSLTYFMLDSSNCHDGLL